MIEKREITTHDLPLPTWVTFTQRVTRGSRSEGEKEKEGGVTILDSVPGLYGEVAFQRRGEGGSCRK